MAFDLIIDTETTDAFGRTLTKPEPENSLVYDLGGVVRDTKTGEIVDSFSFIISETFYNSELMQSAYYASKLPKYYEGMGLEWEVVTFCHAYDFVRSLIKKYNIRNVWAYNARFDLLALNSTIRHYSNGFVRYFLPYKVKVKDVWNRCANVTGTKKYVLWAFENGYVSTKGNPQTSAETVYRYIHADKDFKEQHTAREDAQIEAEILTYAQKVKKGQSEKGLSNGWRAAAKMAQRLRQEELV